MELCTSAAVAAEYLCIRCALRRTFAEASVPLHTRIARSNGEGEAIQDREERR